MSFRGLLLLSLMVSCFAEARSKLPLMPERDPEVPLVLDESLEAKPSKGKFAFLDYQEEKRPRSRAPSFTRSYTPERSSRSSSVLLGLELGTVGRANSTSSDALGLKLLMGGRAFLVLPVGSRVYLKPSLGLFFRNEGAGKVGIAEHMAEGGLNVQYAFSQDGGTRFLVGLVNRLEVSFSKTSISALTASAAPADTSDSSAVLLRYRLGPSIGFTHRLTPTVGLLLDAEVTFSFTNPVKPYGGLVGGLIFRL